VDSIGNWARGYLFLIFRKKKFVDVLRLWQKTKFKCNVLTNLE
jgi:hypothetical protein